MSALVMTEQRQVILEELNRADAHLTADDIYSKVRSRLPKISLGTVYRNLEIMARHELIGKLELAGTQKHFDRNPSAHYHLRCIECGRIDDAPISPLRSLDAHVRDRSDYRILGHHVEFIGYCPRCKSRISGGEKNFTEMEEKWS